MSKEETPEVEAVEVSQEQPTFNVSLDAMNNMAARVMTVIDASIQDPEQRKAIKAIVNQEFNLWAQTIQN